MLEKCDKNEPRVDPEIWDTICPHHCSKAIGHAGINKCPDPQKHTGIGGEYFLAVSRCEDDRRGLEVVCEAWVRALAGGVANDASMYIDHPNRS